MSRTIKKPEARRKEIIQAAQILFETHGYEKTSVESIIQRVGIAKGTFYYYFRTKEDILFAIVEKIIVDLENHFSEINNNPSMKGLDKLKMIFRGKEKTEKISPSLMKTVHLPENRALQEHLNVESIKRIAPLITKILIQVYEEGSCRNKPSLEGTQILLAGIQFTLDSGLFTWTTGQQEVLLKEVENIFECLLGAPKGTFSFISTPTI